MVMIERDKVKDLHVCIVWVEMTFDLVFPVNLQKKNDHLKSLKNNLFRFLPALSLSRLYDSIRIIYIYIYI